MKSPIIIREAQQADLPQIIHLEIEAFAPFGTAETAEIIRERLECYNEGFLVAAQDQTIIAYASSERWLIDQGRSLNESSNERHDKAGKIFCITALAVRAAHRNLGLGSALLKQLIERARQDRCSQIVLETTHAAQFYRSHGFITISEERKNRITLFRMQLSL